MEPYENYIKRLQDFLCTLSAIIVLSPVMFFTALLARIMLRNLAFFTQDRLSKKLERFFKLF